MPAHLLSPSPSIATPLRCALSTTAAATNNRAGIFAASPLGQSSVRCRRRRQALNPDPNPSATMARSAASRLARAARAAAAATTRRQAPGVSREVLPRSLAPLAGDASSVFAAATTRRPAWLAAPLGRFPVGAGGAGILVPPRRLFHSTTPAHYSATGTSSSSQVGAYLCTAWPCLCFYAPSRLLAATRGDSISVSAVEIWLTKRLDC